jgi:hypothetical protein
VGNESVSCLDFCNDNDDFTAVSHVFSFSYFYAHTHHTKKHRKINSNKEIGKLKIPRYRNEQYTPLSQPRDALQ